MIGICNRWFRLEGCQLSWQRNQNANNR